MTATKNAAPAKNDDLVALTTANTDLNDFMNRDTGELADLYGEALYPFFAKSDDKGVIKPYNREKMVAFLDGLKPKMKKAFMTNGINGALKVLRESGMKMDFAVTGKAAQAFQLEEKASFNWTEFLKWVGGIAAVAVIAYGSYRLYIKYTESKSSSSGGNAIAM